MAKGKFERIEGFINPDNSTGLSLATVATQVDAQLAGLVMHQALFAVTIPIFVISLRHLKRHQSKFSYGVLAASLLLILNIANLISGDISKWGIIKWYLDHNTLPRTPSVHLSEIIYEITFRLSVWTADGYLLYRVFETSSKPYLLFLTGMAICFCGEIAVGISDLILQDTWATVDGGGVLGRFLWPSFILTFLLAGPIFDELRRDPLRKSLYKDVLLQSGFCYTLVKICGYAGINTFSAIPAAIISVFAFSVPCLILLNSTEEAEKEAAGKDIVV